MSVLLGKKQRSIFVWAALILFCSILGFTNVSGETLLDGSIWLPAVFNVKAAPNPVHTGIATYYYATGAGACMFDPSPSDLMVSAMNAEES